MKGDLHEIDDLFKAGLEGKEELPEDKVWNAIELDLDKNSVVSLRKKYVRLRRAAAILLILLLCVSIYALRDNLTNNSTKASGHGQARPSVPGKGESPSGNSLNEKTDDDGAEKSSSKTIDPSTGNGLTKTADDPGSNGSAGNSDYKETRKNDEKLANPESNPGITRKEKPAAGREKNIPSNPPKGKSNSSGYTSNNNSRGVRDQNKRGRDNSEAIISTAASSPVIPGNKSGSLWEIAPIEIASDHDFPGNTAKISSANALTDAVKSNPANNLSIPVKNKPNNKLDVPRISITPMASLNLMSNKIKNDLSHPGSQGNEKEDIENTESEELSFTFSLLADLRIAPRMTLQAGIGYMEKTTAIDPKEVGAVRTPEGKIRYQFDCSAGRYYLTPKYGTWPAVGDSAYTIASANELHYITVPLAIRYYFGNNKLNFFAIAGGDANFLLGQDLTTGLYGASYYGKKTPPKPIGLNQVYVNAMLGGGLNYSLNRRFALTFSPTYRFALNPINKDMPFKAYPRSISLAGGLRISL